MTPEAIDRPSLEDLVRFVRDPEIVRRVEHREGSVLIPAGDRTTALPSLRERMRDSLRRARWIVVGQTFRLRALQRRVQLRSCRPAGA